MTPSAIALDEAFPHQRRFVRGSQTVGWLCCGGAAVIGVIVLVGWARDIPLWKSVRPGLVAMNPLTAVCLLLSCLALCALRAGVLSPTKRRLALASSAIVCGVGVARLSSYLFGWALPIDQVLFADALLNADGSHNMMAPNSAFNFAALGGALVLLSLRHARVVLAQKLALCAGATACVALIGYAYSVTSLIHLATFIPMALHTAVAFAFLTTSLLCLDPHSGLVSDLTRDSPGARLMRRMLPAFALGPPVVGWLRLQGEIAGLYSSSFGVALTIGVMVLIGAWSVWTNGRLVDAAEVLRRQSEEELRRLAHHDVLTGLPNRALFFERLTRALVRARRTGSSVAVLFLDLDHFKAVNDTHGHDEGDELLRQASARIQSCVRAADTAARLAGDEFVVLLDDLDAPSDIDMVTQRLLTALAPPYRLRTVELQVSASIGVSVATRDSEDADLLVKQADTAMYQAKRGGKARSVRFDAPVVAA